MSIDLKRAILNRFEGNYGEFYGPCLSGTAQDHHDGWRSQSCPFHPPDRSPSLSWNNDHGGYRDFHDGASGDIFTFYARLHGLDVKTDFQKVLAGIAKDFGIDNGHKEQEAKTKQSQKTSEQSSRVEVISFSAIREMPEDTRPPIIEGLQDLKDSCLLTGQTGKGKSLLVNQIAMYLAEGNCCLFDIEQYKISNPHRVLIIQSELNKRNLRKRLSVQAVGRKSDALERIILPFDGKDICLTGDLLDNSGFFVGKLRKLIERHKVNIVIFDPLVSFHTANENDNVAIRRALDVISKLGVEYDLGTWVIHHHGKLDLQGHYAARGASAICDWASTILTLRDEGANVKVEVSKVRNFKKSPNFYLQKNGLVFSHIEPNSACSPETVAQILLGIGGRVDRQSKLENLIIKEVGCKNRTARSYIQKAVHAGIILEKKDGTRKVYIVKE